MDLVYIAQRYKNIRNLVKLSIILTAFLCIVFAKQSINSNSYTDIDNTVETISKEVEDNNENNQNIETKTEINEEKIENNSTVSQLPILTEENKQAIKNIYKSDKKQVFLTFDDGPSKTVTLPILELLQRENIKATFFVLGSRVELYPWIVKKEYDEGHYIANHGYSHKYAQIYSSKESVIDEYNKTNQNIKDALQNNDYNSLIFRFPGGSTGGKYEGIKSEAIQLLEENNIVHIDWNSLSGDSEGIKDVESLVNRVKETANGKNSVIVLMHDAGDKTYTYEALPQIIEYFRQEGYEFRNFYDVMK